MEPQGLSFGQPISIVCPVIRSPQSAAHEQQRGSVPEPAVGPADEPRRHYGDGAADSTTDRSNVLSTVTADEPSAGDADDSRASVMYVSKDEETSEPRTPSRADDVDEEEEEEDDGPPAAEEAPARVDPLIMLCQAAQQSCHTEDSEQRVPVTPEVHFGELSYTGTPPQNTDDEEAAYGHDELPMEENHELPMEERLRVSVEDERHQELPVQDHHHNSPVQVQQELTVQEQQKVPVQEHYQVPVASAPSAVMVPLRMKGVEVECEVRPLDLKGSTLLSAAAQGGLTVAVAPGNQQEGSSKVATQKLYFLYPESQEVYAAPVPQVDSTAVAQEVYVAPVTQDGCTTVTQEVYVAPVTQNGSTTVTQPTDARMVTFFDRAGEPPTSGRDSPAVLHFLTQHGKRQLHLSLNCDGETCCRSQDTPSYASDSTVQISETVQASLSGTVQEPATTEYRPQNADGESQKLEKEPDVTIASPDSTGDEQTAVGQDSPVQEETTECTSDAQPNSNTAESESSGPASATQDAAATTDTSPDQMADTNLNNSEAKRDNTVEDSAPDLSCTNSEAKNPSLHGRRTKNPVRRHIVSATPSNGRKPVSRRHGTATSDSVVTKGRRKSCVADPAPVKEPEEQQMRDNRHSAQEVIRTEEAATDASESVNAASGTRSTVRKDFGCRRGGSRGSERRRRPVAAASPSPRANSTATEAGVVAGAGERDHDREAKRKKRLRDTTAHKAAKASSRSRDEWMLQPLYSPPGQDAPLRLVVKRRTLTVSESSDLPSEYAVKEAVKSPLGIQVEDIEKSKTGLRRRRHSTNDCQSNNQESQMNKSRHFSQNMDKPNFSVQWRKRRKPARHLNVNSEDDLSNDADDDNDDDDEDWVPNSHKQRKSVTGGHNNLSKRMNLAKRRKSVASGTDELLQIPCTETVATMTAFPERLAEKNKEESLITSIDTLPVSERNKTTVAETIVTALTDTSKSSVEEPVSDTTHDSVASHSTTKYNQPVVSSTQHKVACNTDESYQEPAPKKYKKAWQELWSAQQNDEQAKASLTETPHRTEELPHEDEECTRDHTQQSTAETSPASSSHVVPPSSSSHMNQQETSEVQCKDKALETGAISSGLAEDPHSMSDNSVETLSDTTTDESDNEAGPVTLHKCRSVVPHQGVPHQGVPVHTLHHPGLTSQQPQGLVSEGLYVVNGRTLRVRVQEVEDGPLDPALSQVPREIIERCVQQLKRSNELVPSVHSLHNGLFPLKYFNSHHLDIKPFICHNIGHKMERPFYPPCTRIKEEPVDDLQHYSQPPIFAPSSGKFPYAGQPLGCSNMVIQTEGCRRKVCYRRKGVSVQKKDGSQNNDVIVISDSDDDCSRNNSDASTKFQGGDEKKDGDSNDNDDIKILSDLSLTGPWSKKDILYGTELRQRIYRTLRTEILRKKKGFLKKLKEEYEKGKRSFKAAQQESSSLSQLTDEAYLWGIVSQLTSTEAVGKNVNSYSQKHIEQMAEHECDMQGPENLCYSSSINLKSDMCPLNDTERSVLFKKGQKQSVASLLESAEKSSNSDENDALKMEDNLHQFFDITEENTEDIPLNNCQHRNQQIYTSKRQVSGAEEIAESNKHMSSSAVPEPDSLHVSVKEFQSPCLEVNNRVSVLCSNSLIVGSMTAKIDSDAGNLPMDVNKLVTEDDGKHPKLCDGQKLADLKLESCQASNNVDKNKADCIHIADLNNMRQETCKSSGDVVIKEAINTHAVDTNDVAQKLCERCGNLVTKLADDIPVIDLGNVAQEIRETSSDIVTKQTDKTLGDNLNDVTVKERLITDQSPPEENSESSAGVRHPKEESKMELYGDENRQQHLTIDKQHSLNVSQLENKQNTTNTKTENATDSMTDSEVVIVKMKVMSKSMEPNTLEGIDVIKKNTECSLKNSERLSPKADCNITQCEDVPARTTGGCNNQQHMLSNVHESVNLKNVSSVRPEADLCITIDITSDDSQSEASPGLPSPTLTDISLKEMVTVRNSPNLPQVGGSSITVDGGQSEPSPGLPSPTLTDISLKEMVTVRNSSNLPQVGDSSITVDEGCEVSNQQVTAAISSENLIEQLVQSQQNSRVFDPLASLIKTRPTECGDVPAGTTGGCNNEQHMLPNVHESVNLKNVSSVRPEADLCITIDITSDDSQSEQSPGLPSPTLTDISLKEMVTVRNSPNLPQVGGSSITVDGGCEVSNQQVPAAVSSQNLIEQLVQSQQNSRVFDPLVSLIKTRPIVGDFALRYEMMVNKELTRLHNKEAKEKEKRNKMKIGFLVDSKTKKKKKKKKKKLFPGKGFCSFEDNDKDLDGCGPGKGGFSGGTLTFTAIVSYFSSACIFPLYDNFLNKTFNLCKCRKAYKWSKCLSHTLCITCWLLYFSFQHLCPFTL